MTHDELLAENARLKAELDRERAHIPGKYAFLHRHYAMMCVRQVDPNLHSWAASEAGQKLDREGAKSYVDYVAQLEADNAALWDALDDALVMSQIPQDLWVTEGWGKTFERLNALHDADHPGAPLLAELEAARAALSAFVAAYDAQLWPIENDIGLFEAARRIIAAPTQRKRTHE